MGKKNKAPSQADLVVAYVRTGLDVKLEGWQEAALREIIESVNRPKTERQASALAPWLYARFGQGRHSPAWADAGEGAHSYWSHEAEAVQQAALRERTEGIRTSLSLGAVRISREAAGQYGTEALEAINRRSTPDVDRPQVRPGSSRFSLGWYQGAPDGGSVGQYSEPMVGGQPEPRRTHTAYGVDGGAPCFCPSTRDHGVAGGAD